MFSLGTVPFLGAFIIENKKEKEVNKATKERFLKHMFFSLESRRTKLSVPSFKERKDVQNSSLLFLFSSI